MQVDVQADRRVAKGRRHSCGERPHQAAVQRRGQSGVPMRHGDQGAVAVHADI